MKNPQRPAQQRRQVYTDPVRKAKMEIPVTMLQIRPADGGVGRTQ
jgi:hypothetical protein